MASFTANSTIGVAGAQPTDFVGTTRLWAGGTTTFSATEDIAPTAGVTVRARDCDLFATQLSGFVGGAHDYENVLVNQAGGESASLSNFRFRDVTWYKSGLVATHNFGRWTGAGSGSVYDIDGLNVWGNVSPTDPTLAFLVFFPHTNFLADNPIINNVSLWNGRDGEDALGGVVTIAHGVFPGLQSGPFGFRPFLVNAGSTTRSLYRIAVGTVVDDRYAMLLSYDFRAIHNTTAEWRFSHSFAGNAFMINPLVGLPTGAGQIRWANQGNVESKVRYLVGHQPSITSEYVKFVNSDTNVQMWTPPDTFGIATTALPQTVNDIVTHTDLSQGVGNGILFTQQSFDLDEGTATLFDGAANGQSNQEFVAAGDMSYRVYPWDQVGWGNEYSVSPTVAGAPNTVADAAAFVPATLTAGYTTGAFVSFNDSLYQRNATGAGSISDYTAEADQPEGSNNLWTAVTSVEEDRVSGVYPAIDGSGFLTQFDINTATDTLVADHPSPLDAMAFLYAGFTFPTFSGTTLEAGYPEGTIVDLSGTLYQRNATELGAGTDYSDAADQPTGSNNLWNEFQVPYARSGRQVATSIKSVHYEDVSTTHANLPYTHTGTELVFTDNINLSGAATLAPATSGIRTIPTRGLLADSSVTSIEAPEITITGNFLNNTFTKCDLVGTVDLEGSANTMNIDGDVSLHTTASVYSNLNINGDITNVLESHGITNLNIQGTGRSISISGFSTTDQVAIADIVGTGFTQDNPITINSATDINIAVPQAAASNFLVGTDGAGTVLFTLIADVLTQTITHPSDLSGTWAVIDTATNAFLEGPTSFTAGGTPSSIDLLSTDTRNIRAYWRANTSRENGYNTTIYNITGSGILENGTVTILPTRIADVLWNTPIGQTTTTATALITEGNQDYNSVDRLEVTYTDAGGELRDLSNGAARTLLVTLLATNNILYMNRMGANGLDADIILPGINEVQIDGRYCYLDSSAGTTQVQLTSITDTALISTLSPAGSITPVNLTGVTGSTVVILPPQAGATPGQIAAGVAGGVNTASSIVDIANRARFLTDGRKVGPYWSPDNDTFNSGETYPNN